MATTHRSSHMNPSVSKRRFVPSLGLLLSVLLVVPVATGQPLQDLEDPIDQEVQDQAAAKPPKTEVDDVKALFLAEFEILTRRLESEVVMTYAANPGESLEPLRKIFKETFERIEKLRREMVCEICPDGWYGCGRCTCCAPVYRDVPFLNHREGAKIGPPRPEGIPG